MQRRTDAGAGSRPVLARRIAWRLRVGATLQGGDVLWDRTTRQDFRRRALLGSFFAEGSDFREPLIHSLLRR